MKPNVLCAIALLAIVAASASAEPFAAGQTWSYAARPDQVGSRVIVLRVEEYPKIGRVVHVSITGLALRRAPGGTPEGWNIAHVAFAEAALRSSVIQLESSPATPPAVAEATYRRWRKGADRGKVQRRTIPVADAVGQIERWVREGRS
jgi:hypothetical protein